MTALSVNLNKVALLRNQRDIGYPSVIAAARTVLDAGAQGVTVHPRPDERHTRYQDVRDLARLVRADYPNRELNVEGNPDARFLDLIAETRPHQVTLVPDAPDQRTSDHGWDLERDGRRLADLAAGLRAHGCRSSVFLDADPALAAGAAAAGVDRIEIYTGPYAMAVEEQARARILASCAALARDAADRGLGVNAGHDLNRDNLAPFLAVVPGVAEVSIGHAFTADALWLGLAATVTAYRAIIEQVTT